ncbi:CAP domain protein [Ophiocordyceps sinensis CO18]|uniref:CAP domain protein n=1 Tax=Ophiocordyceps sinensis (strain Co18 / CGMCC 3.14243) TaxID=911162 RepID=T5AI40_OPHSC|nr:CAP domain protein [Ophiocordyceps sinensis CO18]
MRLAPLLPALPLAAALPKSPAGENELGHVKRWNIHTWPGSDSWKNHNSDAGGWWRNGQGRHQPQDQGAQNEWDNQDRQGAARGQNDYNGNRDGGNGRDQGHQQPDSGNNRHTDQGSQSSGGGWGGPGEVLTFPGSPHGDYEAFKGLFVDWHNYVRGKHQDTGGLSWNEELAEDARKWSAQCVYDHGHAPDSDSKGWGQNIAFQSTNWRDRDPNEEEKKPFYDVPGQVTYSIRGWWEWERFLLDWNTYEVDWSRAEGVVDYLQKRDNKAKIVAQVGHFTQMIWKETTQVGCAVSVCKPIRGKQGGTITVGENTLASNPRWGQTDKEFYKQNIGQPWDWNAFNNELFNPVM